MTCLEVSGVLAMPEVGYVANVIILRMKPDISQGDVLTILRREMPVLQREFGVEKIALYGSFARNTASAKSDVDIIVQLSKPLGFGFVRLASYLEKSLGRKVDLATFNSLKSAARNPHRAHIAAEIERTLVYA